MITSHDVISFVAVSFVYCLNFVFVLFDSVNAALKKLSPHMREKLRAAQLASKGGARTLLLPTEGRSGVERCLNHILTTVGCAPLNDSMDLLVPGKIEFAPQKELSSGDQLDDTASNAAEDYLSQR